MSDLEIVLLIALGVMIALWHIERRRAGSSFLVAQMFHLSLIRIAKKELTLSIDSEDKLTIKEIGSDKTITVV
jgi:hypothetical protein